jgi:drug/metabolite transporter (DMT)-like permease
MISLTDSLTLHFTMPIFATLFALMILRERVGSHRWVAMVLGFIGVLVVLRPGFYQLNQGMLAALRAAACFGLCDVLLRKLSRTDITLSIIFYSFVFQVPFSLPLALINWVMPTLTELLWLVAMGAVSFGAQWSLSRAYILADASVVSPVLFIRLPMVSLIGLFFFSQVTDMWTWIGMAIIFGNTYYAARREASDGK